MPLVPMKQILEEADTRGYGVGAFNMNNMEQLQGIMEAAAEKNSPVILQVSEGALKYSGMDALPAMLKAMMQQEKYKDLKVSLHLDHGRDLKTCKDAIALGFTSVMYDGSLDETGKKQQSYEDNVRKTRDVVEYAHARGVTVEGELGALGGSDEVKAGKIEYTKPDQVADFVQKTGVDALAISIGTSHGAYKFAGEPSLALHLIPDIKANAGHAKLVMHGSSSVPKEMIAAIDQFTVIKTTTDNHGKWAEYKKGTAYVEDGKPKIKFEDKRVNLDEITPETAMEMAQDLRNNHRLAQARGVPTAMIQEGIKNGIRKVNIDTDGRLALTGAILTVLHASPDKFDPRDYLKPGREAIKKWVGQEMEYFGSAGHNADYKPVSLEDMKREYARPEMLTPPAPPETDTQPRRRLPRISG